MLVFGVCCRKLHVSPQRHPSLAGNNDARDFKASNVAFWKGLDAPGTASSQVCIFVEVMSRHSYWGQKSTHTALIVSLCTSAHDNDGLWNASAIWLRRWILHWRSYGNVSHRNARPVHNARAAVRNADDVTTAVDANGFSGIRMLTFASNV